MKDLRDLKLSTLTSTTRNDASASRIVELNALPNTGGLDFFFCPITMLLVLALRTGAVSSTTIGSLIAETKQRSRKAVAWAHPDRSVFSAFLAQGRGLVLDKPAPASQLAQTLREAAILCGLAENLIPHDLRRGAAKDGQMLHAFHAKMNINASVGATLGHSRYSFNLGVTDQYVEPVTPDVWSERLATVTKRKWDLEPTVIPTSTKRLRSTTAEVTAAMKEGDQDPKARSKARRQLRAAKLAQREPLGGLDTNNPNGNTTVAAATGRNTDIPNSNTIVTAETGRNTEISNESQPPDPAETGYDNIPIDPALLDNTIDNIVSGQDESEMSVETVVAILGRDSADPAWNSNQSRVAFMDEYASINIVNNVQMAMVSNSDRTTMLGLDHFNGGSKDRPTLFMYGCPNHNQGCDYTHRHQIGIEQHRVGCIVAVSRTDGTKVCEECGKKYKNKYILHNHVRIEHKWTPKVCHEPGPGCTDQLIESGLAWIQHRRKFHSQHKPSTTWEPQACLVPDCSSKHVFETKTQYKAHLNRLHKLHATKHDDYLPLACQKPKDKPEKVYTRTGKTYTFRAALYEPQGCLVPDCKSKHIFPSMATYKQHLHKYHNLEYADIEPYLPVACKREMGEETIG